MTREHCTKDKVYACSKDHMLCAFELVTPLSTSFCCKNVAVSLLSFLLKRDDFYDPG
jgi:hypothetical protein